MNMKRNLLAIAALLPLAAAPAGAQAFAYPSFQQPLVAEREYNFGLVDVDGGATSILAQWREGLGNPKLQFTLDAGFVDFDAAGVDASLFLYGGLAYQLTRAKADMPFDMVLTGGIGFTAGDVVDLLRVPFGISVGHRFPLERSMALTPYVHPRLSIDRASAGGASNTDTNVDVDLGVNWEFNPSMALRLSATLSDPDALGISFAWTPRGMRK